ncbi:hypothetical protein BH11PSE11_BH11PSE11_12320 [soil metagenome]
MTGPQIKKAPAATGASLLNTQLDYAPLGDLVQANIDGQRLASAAVADLHSHFADPDALYLSLKSVMPDIRDIEALTKMRGFMRIVQKCIERSAA